MVEGRAHLRLGAAVDEVDGGHALHLFAHADAAPAQDALGRVADDGGAGGVDAVVVLVAGVAAVAHAVLLGQLLQAAVAVADAVEAVVGMVGQQQLHHRLAGADDALRVRLDLHALGHRVGAAGDEVARAGQLHHAQAAGARGEEVAHVAQRRHVDARAPQGAEDRLAGLGLDESVVDFNRYHGCFLYSQEGGGLPRPPPSRHWEAAAPQGRHPR